MPGEASLSQELPTPELLQAQVLVGYRWQNIGLGPVDSVPTATEATSCRNLPNGTCAFQRIPLSSSTRLLGGCKLMDKPPIPERTSRSTAQPVTWCPPLCRRARHHSFFRHLRSLVHLLILCSFESPLADLHLVFPIEHWRCERSLISYRKVIATRSCLLYAGRAMK